jgi:PIN domain nuclease of toxin-antitoxin system
MNPSFEVIVSTAVVWEIVLKVQSGKLKIPNPVSWIEDELGRLNATILPIKLNHALEAHRSPLRHRDPFDRMLFAQATIEKCPLLTSDPLILGQGQTIAIW